MKQSNAQLKAWAAFLLVFALGGVTGASIDGIYRLRAANASAPTAPVVSIRDTDTYFETLKRELTLSGEQQTAIRAVLDHTRDEYKAVCADVRPRYDTVREKARAQMRELLTADQQPRFDSIITAENCQCPDPKK
jgi:uncharacterized membrane protein